MKKEECFKLGTFIKLHGTEGRLVLSTGKFDLSTFSDSAFFYVDMEGGLVPYFISESGPHGRDAILVLFEDMHSPEKAKKLLNLDVYLPLSQLPEFEEEGFYGFEIEQYDVIDKTLGNIGKVIDIYELPKNPLLRIAGSKGEILIPMEADFIQRIDKKKKCVYIDAPEKLIDLNS